MNKILLLIFLLGSITVSGVGKDSIKDISNILELTIDSIEIVISEDKWGMDTSHVLHYNIINITEDTIYYCTNTCPSYNLYELTIGNKTYPINTGIACELNAIDRHTILPNKSISIDEEIHIRGDFFKKFIPALKISFAIPVNIGYRKTFSYFSKKVHADEIILVNDGHFYGKNDKKGTLIYEGNISVLNKFVTELSKRQKRRKHRHLLKSMK